MISKFENIVIITCDKCKIESTAREENYNDTFWQEGWILNKGRKYEHLCYNCLPNNKKKTMDQLKQFIN